MIKTVLKTAALLGLTATLLAGTAEARGFGGFRGHGFHGGHFHGHHHHHRHFGFGRVHYGSFGGCFDRRFVDRFGRVFIKRSCD